jgi:hypothetical protein
MPLRLDFRLTQAEADALESDYQDVFLNCQLVDNDVHRASFMCGWVVSLDRATGQQHVVELSA